jgi:hypothetical protein
MTPKNSVESLIYNSKECPFGHTWQYWTTRWWKWFLSIPKKEDSAIDKLDKKSYVGSSDSNVIFLASTIEGRVDKNVKISSGKAVLFPVINITISNSEEPTLNTDNDMISFVRKHMDEIVKKQASIDGEDLLISEKFRVQSPPFNFKYPPNNIFGAREGPARGSGDGYWIFLRPLQPGKHTIKSFGSCMSGKVQIDARINLVVESFPHNHQLPTRERREQ